MELVDMVGIGSWSLFFFDWRLDWFMELVFGWRAKAVAEILLRILESSTQPSSGSRPPSRCLPKVEDEADEWDPLGNERICGTQLSERGGREELVRGVGRTFRVTLLTVRQRVMPLWRATSAKVVKM